MPPSPEPDATSRVLALAHGFMPSRVLLSAVELGVFDQFTHGPQTAAQISDALGADRRAMEILLNALVAVDILKQQDGRFELRPEMAGVLLPNGPHAAADALLHACRLWDTWSDLTRIVREGRPQPRARNEEASTALALAMRFQARDAAAGLAAFLEGFDLHKILDLGGGSGAYSIALARRIPRLRVVLCDHDEHALRLAATDIDKAELGERIHVLEADALTDDIGSDYDLVLLSSVLCTYSADQSRLLLEKVKDALKPGGRVVIRDHMLDEATSSPPAAALFSVCMLVASAGGRVHTRSELRTWLEDLGYVNVHWLPVEPIPLMLAQNAHSACP